MRWSKHCTARACGGRGQPRQRMDPGSDPDDHRRALSPSLLASHPPLAPSLPHRIHLSCCACSPWRRGWADRWAAAAGRMDLWLVPARLLQTNPAIARSLQPRSARAQAKNAGIQLASARGFHKSVRVEDSCSEMLRMRMVTKLDPSKAVLLESPPPSAALRPQSFIPGGTTRECAARPRAEDWQSRAGCGAGGAECLFSTRLPPRLPRRRRRRTRFRPEQKRKKRRDTSKQAAAQR